MVCKDGISAKTDKTQVAKERPEPKAITAVRSIANFISYYRRFIKDLSKKAMPLKNFVRNLDKTHVKSSRSKRMADLSDKQQQAIEKLRTLCIKTPILAYPYFTLPFKVHTDTSQDD